MATDVVWLSNDSATREHAVDGDTVVPRGPFRVATVCRPSSLTTLLPPGKVLGTELPRCKACQRKLFIAAHLATDPPPAGTATRRLPAGARHTEPS